MHVECGGNRCARRPVAEAFLLQQQHEQRGVARARIVSVPARIARAASALPSAKAYSRGVLLVYRTFSWSFYVHCQLCVLVESIVQSNSAPVGHAYRSNVAACAIISQNLTDWRAVMDGSAMKRSLVAAISCIAMSALLSIYQNLADRCAHMHTQNKSNIERFSQTRTYRSNGAVGLVVDQQLDY